MAGDIIILENKCGSKIQFNLASWFQMASGQHWNWSLLFREIKKNKKPQSSFNYIPFLMDIKFTISNVVFSSSSAQTHSDKGIYRTRCFVSFLSLVMSNGYGTLALRGSDDKVNASRFTLSISELNVCHYAKVIKRKQLCQKL